MEILVIEENRVLIIDSNKITAKQIGQKALGLIDIPSPWRLPFLCISASVFQRFLKAGTESKQRAVITRVAKHIRSCLPQIGIEKGDTVIIRSSGIVEGMAERGRYDSHESNVYEIEQSLWELLSSLLEKFGSKLQMSFVIQKYVQHAVLGHLSNERRFSKDKRDWVFEYSLGGEIISDKIGVRFWRTMLANVEDKILACNAPIDIPSALYTVAWYYTKKKKVVHFEFVWDKGAHRIVLVQGDLENDRKELCVDPTAFNIRVNDKLMGNFKLLRQANDFDQKYSKVSNTLLYKQIGLCTVPLYILDDKEHLQALAQKKVMPQLEADLRTLSVNSIVVRTDIAHVDKAQKQLLARSNEIRNYDDLIDWLFLHQEFLSMDAEIALLFHVFVPALGAAFANASPTGRIVEIEALWGLPEGLYYNAHDKITVDTKSVDAEIASAENAEILSKRAGFKEYFIAPDKDGRWVSMRTAPPYDWNLCIDDEDIKQVAVESRRIANLAGKSVSIMWFLGIDRDYYGTDNLAWYHEEYSKDGYTASEYKKKYFYETEAVIQNEADYQAFKESSDTKEVKLRPADDTLLRDKEFLKKIGEAAKEKGATIILEGSILSHPLYQLCQTGARVLTPDRPALYKEESNYGKLVRDKIPEKILNNGEDIVCYVLEKDAFFRALLEKAVEESIEVASATTKDELIEELGDEYEVLSSILLLSSTMSKVDFFQRKEIGKIGAFDKTTFETKIFDLINQSIYDHFNVPKVGYVEVEASYEGTRLQIELHFYHVQPNKEEKQFRILRLTDNEIIEAIFKNALLLSTYTDITSIRDTVMSMQSEIIELLAMHQADSKEFIEVVSKKRQKRGGFSKGFLLKSSSISSEQEDEQPQTQLCIVEDSYSTVPLLEYKTVKNADFLEKGNGELVLRMSLPLCFNSYEATFANNTVKKYAGDNDVLVRLIRDGSVLSVSVGMIESDKRYIQSDLWQ